MEELNFSLNSVITRVNVDKNKNNTYNSSYDRRKIDEGIGENMIIDTHAHYDDEAFNEDRNDLLLEMKRHGIETVVNIGASIETSKNTIELTKQYENVYGVIGVHPSESAELTDERYLWLKDHANDPKIVGIGEIGLDYYWDTPERDLQKYWFKRQLTLAIDLEMPVVIHSRDAAEDTLTIMKQAKQYAMEQGKTFQGVIHCFSYGVELAREYVKLGFYIGIGGVVTFKNAKKLKEVVAETPIEWLVLETDSPYLSPEPNRGKRNSSLNLTYVVNKIAEIKGISETEVIRVTNQNAKSLYQRIK